MKDIMVKTRNRVWMGTTIKWKGRKRVSNKGQRCDGVGNISVTEWERGRKRNGDGLCYAINVTQSRKCVSFVSRTLSLSLSPPHCPFLSPLSLQHRSSGWLVFFIKASGKWMDFGSNNEWFVKCVNSVCDATITTGTYLFFRFYWFDLALSMFSNWLTSPQNSSHNCIAHNHYQHRNRIS